MYQLRISNLYSIGRLEMDPMGFVHYDPALRRTWGERHTYAKGSERLIDPDGLLFLNSSWMSICKVVSYTCVWQYVAHFDATRAYPRISRSISRNRDSYYTLILKLCLSVDSNRWECEFDISKPGLLNIYLAFVNPTWPTVSIFDGKS